MANQILRLTSLEYDSILKDLIDYVKNKYPNEWNDFLHSNLGMVFLEAVSAVGDNLAFYINQLANELFLPTATQRRAVVNLAKLVGYTPKRAVPATGLIRFYLNSPLPYDVRIPKESICETEDGIRFETTEEGIIPAGQTEVLVNATQRDVQEISLVASQEGFTEIEIDSEGAYEFEVHVNGVRLEETQFIVDAFQSPAYKIEEKESGYVVILWTNAGDQIRVRYYFTEGSRGNVGSGAISRLITPARDVGGNQIGIGVDNLPFAGGQDREDVQSIKKNAYLFTRTQNRAVSQEDYTNMALLVDGVYKAKAKLVNWGCSANIVYVYLCSVDSNGTPVLAPQSVKDAAVRELTEKGILTVQVYAQDVAFQSVSISGNLKVKAGFDPASVQAKIESRIKDLFASLNIGDTLRYSDLYRTIDETKGVEWVELTSPTASVSPADDVTLLTYGGASWNVV